MDFVRKRPLTNEKPMGTEAQGVPSTTVKTLDSYPLPPQPYLVNSVTVDEDDELDSNKPDESTEPTNFRWIGSMDMRENNTSAGPLPYISGYDAMVQQQDAEHLAMLSHMLPLLRTLSSLATNANEDNNHDRHLQQNENTSLLREISYSGLKHALDTIESDDSYGFIRTDRQLMLVLRVLTKQNDYQGKADQGTIQKEQRITWGEIMQCYKICVVGMQTLEKTPEPKNIRDRVRERSLYMMSLFQPVSNKNLQDVAVDAAFSDSTCKESHTWNSTFQEASKLTTFIAKENRSTLTQLVDFAKLVATLIICCLCFQSLGNIFTAEVRSGSTMSTWQPTSRVEPTVWTPTPYTPTPVHIQTSPVVQGATLQQPSATPDASKDSHISAPPANLPPLKHTHSQKAFQQLRDHPQTKANTVKIKEKFSANGMAMTALSGGVVATCLSLMAPLAAQVAIPVSASVVPLLPVGVTVVSATLVAHGVRAIVIRLLERFQNVR